MWCWLCCVCLEDRSVHESPRRARPAVPGAALRSSLRCGAYGLRDGSSAPRPFSPPGPRVDCATECRLFSDTATPLNRAGRDLPAERGRGFASLTPSLAALAHGRCCAVFTGCLPGARPRSQARSPAPRDGLPGFHPSVRLPRPARMLVHRDRTRCLPPTGWFPSPRSGVVLLSLLFTVPMELMLLTVPMELPLPTTLYRR
jgi:hypothetical protein